MEQDPTAAHSPFLIRGQLINQDRPHLITRETDRVPATEVQQDHGPVIGVAPRPHRPAVLKL